MKGSIRTLSPADGMRLLGGAVLQPFIAAGLAFVLFPFLLLDGEGRTLAGGYPSDPTDAALSVALGAGIVAGVVTLTLVLPTTIWLVKRRELTLRTTLLFGLAFGLLPYILVGVAARGTYGPLAVLRGFGFSAILGLSGAAVFWIIAVRSRPGHDAAAGFYGE